MKKNIIKQMVKRFINFIVTCSKNNKNKCITEYGHCVNKPYSFLGKMLYFFGDSITAGVTTGYTITSNGYPKLFSDHVGASFKNYAQSGSLLVSGYNTSENTATPTCDVIKNTTLNSDFIFITGGVNDWQNGVPLDVFETIITDLCNYLSINYLGEVIWITPINQVGWLGNSFTTIDAYTDIIVRVISKYNHSVIIGSKFNFPKENIDYTTLLFDGLHPTEIGYKLYAKSLSTILS